MARLSISRETLNALFAKSGNVCAFPGCTHELVTARGLFVGQLCHIEAANRGGARYNEGSTDEERRSFTNLLLLCYRHHQETNDVSEFDVAKLRSIKNGHEAVHGQKVFKVNEAFLYRLEEELREYWEGFTEAHRSHVIPELAARIPMGLGATAQFSELFRSVGRLGEILDGLSKADDSLNDEIRVHLRSLGYDLQAYDEVPYYKNPFFHRNWETHALAVNNTMTDLVVALTQSQVRFLEEYLKTHPGETDVIDSLSAARDELREMARSAGYAD